MEKITRAVEDSQFVATLFDRGSFNLAVLWSCNTMEQIIDTASKEIILRDSRKKELFRKEDNERLGYPRQFRNLGFKPHLEENRKEEQITLEVLWHEIRRDVAHYNYRPTFPQTCGAIHIFVDFIKEMPAILQTLFTGCSVS